MGKISDLTLAIIIIILVVVILSILHITFNDLITMLKRFFAGWSL